MDVLDLLVRISSPIIAGVALGLAWSTYRTWVRRAIWAQQTAVIALDRLEAMERAHDYGRDVHTRLAAAVESELILADGPPVPDPATRRNMGMMFAGRLLEACKRANLEVTPIEPAEETQ